MTIAQKLKKEEEKKIAIEIFSFSCLFSISKNSIVQSDWEECERAFSFDFKREKRI